MEASMMHKVVAQRLWRAYFVMETLRCWKCWTQGHTQIAPSRRAHLGEIWGWGVDGDIAPAQEDG